MEPTFEELIKGFGHTKKGGGVKHNSKQGDLEQKGSRLRNDKVGRPRRDDADVHGINSLINEMMDVDEDHPVVHVKSVFSKDQQREDRATERYHSDEGEASSDEEAPVVWNVASKGTPCVVNKDKQCVINKGTRRDDRASERYHSEESSSDEETPVVRSAVGKGTQREGRAVVHERYQSDEGEVSSDEPIEPFKSPCKPEVATSSTKLIVNNLALTVDQEDFEELFEEFEGVLKIVLGTDNKGQSMGTGYALFSSRAEALKAVSIYNEVPLDDKPLQMSVQPLPKPPQPKPEPVLKVPKRPSVFSRLSREPLKTSVFQTHYSNKSVPSVFTRLSREPIVTSALQKLSKLDHKMRSSDSNISTTKRYRDESPEDGAISDSGDDIADYQGRPRHTHLDREENTSKRRHYRDYGPPKRSIPRYIDYDNPEHLEHQVEENLRTYKKSRYHDYDNPENYSPPERMFRRSVDYDNPYPKHQAHPVRSSYTDHHRGRKENHQERKENRRDHSSKMRGFDGGRRRGGPASYQRPRITAEELDAELEEMVNPTIDTDVFGH